MEYIDFLSSKKIINNNIGINPTSSINSMLFDFQQDIVIWALRKGRAAIFADCGLGKTPMQLEWADQVCKHTGNSVLIVAPLAVSRQTKNEGVKFGVSVNICKGQNDVREGVNITNYERLENFNPDDFAGIILDESSILKSYSGKIRNQIIEMFENTPFRLACTATPAPNDYMELGNHSEFLGVMKRSEMLATFFVHDGGDTSKWRLKGHAQDKYWEWMSSWAVVIQKPSDLGYDDDRYILPELNIIEHILESDNTGEFLFPMAAGTLQERRDARKESIKVRTDHAAELANNDDGQWLVWCDFNAESDLLTRKIDGAVEVKGSDDSDHKESAMVGFSSGDIRCMVTKPSIAGFGMNWQNCHNMIFAGLSDSYEQFYQAVRRCYRFGQTETVNVHVIISERERSVLDNIKRKQEDADYMAKNMVKHTAAIKRKDIRATFRDSYDYQTNTEHGDGWTLYLGDCVEQIKKINDDSIHYSVFSPPFASLYTYTNSERDMGNCRTNDEFMSHFKFLVDELYRVIMPGRLVSFHCMNLPMSKERDGVIGIRDFRGELIKVFTDAGFVFHSEVCIWKDPVTAMQRTKAIGLLYKQLKKDSCISRQGIPDYLVSVRKPGDNPEMVSHTNESFPVNIWQKYASPVWMDINPNDTLQRASARENNDERHICPLQLEVISRALKLWSNEGDIVLSPFAGIGSEGFQSIVHGRQFIGIELKKSYFDCAVNNLKVAEVKAKEQFLFSVR